MNSSLTGGIMKRLYSGTTSCRDLAGCAQATGILDRSAFLATTKLINSLAVQGSSATNRPADRLGELLLEMKKTAIEPKYLRVVHASRRSDAKMVLVEGIKDARRGFKIGPPLVMVDEAGCYTAEMARMFEADFKFPDH